jgi:8-amino-3,8-dideoxy-alpha-D-manno-octulosonate transaminase
MKRKKIKRKIKRFVANTKVMETSRRNMRYPFLSFYGEIATDSIRRKNDTRNLLDGQFGFSACLIETYGFCNRQCSFCHNNPSFTQRDKGIMNKSLYKKIIDELSELGFSGRISPHGFGEPLLDKRLPDLISYARKKCPLSYIKFNSNGDFLTEDLVKKLIDGGMNLISVTNYDEFEKPHLTTLAKKYPYYIKYKNSHDYRKYSRPQEDLTDDSYLCKPCMEPTNKMVINWQGKVIICCQDIYARYCMGDLNTESIVDIVSRIKFMNLRRMISEGNRQKIDICKKCTHD